MKLQNKHDTDDRWIYERNPDTGEIFRRKPMDYNNKELINPEINSVPRCEEYIDKALNLRGAKWMDFVDSIRVDSYTIINVSPFAEVTSFSLIF